MVQHVPNVVTETADRKVRICSDKPIKTDRIVIIRHNQFHNTFRLFDVLPNFVFTTSETICVTYKHGI